MNTTNPQNIAYGTTDTNEAVRVTEQGSAVLSNAHDVARRIVGRVRQALDGADVTDPSIHLDGTDPDARPLPPDV